MFCSREYGKLKSDVDLADLAKRTKNFSGAEIEGLVRAALSTAMNRLIKVFIRSHLILKIVIIVKQWCL